MFCLPVQLSGYQIAQMLQFLSVIILPFQNFSVSSLKGFIWSSSFINLFKCISQTKQVSCSEMSGSRSRFENILQNTIVQTFQGKQRNPALIKEAKWQVAACLSQRPSGPPPKSATFTPASVWRSCLQSGFCYRWQSVLIFQTWPAPPLRASFGDR